MCNISSRAEKQSIYIVRYGLTAFPLVESLGPFNSDIDPIEGVEHAHLIAKSIASEGRPPSIVYSSPFTRCAHTAQLLAQELPDSSVRIENGLMEWLIPSLLVEPNGIKTLPKTLSELALAYGTIDDTYQSVNPEITDQDATIPEGAPHFQETEADLMKRCALTMDRILQQHPKGESLAIVSHAPCDQSIALFLEGARSPQESKLGPWPLGGITKFSREIRDDGSFGSWSMDGYGNTKHMPGKYTKGLKHWSLPCLVH